MEGYIMNITSNKQIINRIDNPYKIWIIDNFLNDDVIKNILKEWLPNDHKNWYKTRDVINGKKNILEQGMLGINNPELMPDYIKSVVQYLHTQEFTDYLTNLLNIESLICDKYMRWSGMRVMLPDSFQLIHSDARKHTETGLTKHLTCLLYLNENYSKSKDEGCLQVWDDNMKVCTHEIEPISNRLTVFVNSDTSYHGVPIVKSDRKAITFSILKNEENTNRTKALFVKRPNDFDLVELEGLDRLKEKDPRTTY